ncbi:MAG: DUF928 domain-containing protein [Pseudanabaenales cyanobacterium]|nr:DUF928 domain-containing protein [Pseudanabaenales cyanobacterium]
MFRQNHPLKALLAAFCIKLAFAPGLPVYAQVQPEAPTSINTRSLTGGVNFVPPADDGAPEYTAGGASRGRCPGEVAYATPLTRNSHYGLTASTRPSIFLHIPQTTVQEVFFSLKDEDNNHLFQTRFAIPSNSGVVRFDLPDTAPELSPDTEYKWSFVLLCNNRLRPDSPRIEGWVQFKQDPNLMEQAAAMDFLERAILYGEQGIWFDTLTALAELRQLQTQEPTTWTEFLESAGLTAIATEPLVGAATPLGN